MRGVAKSPRHLIDPPFRVLRKRSSSESLPSFSEDSEFTSFTSDTPRRERLSFSSVSDMLAESAALSKKSLISRRAMRNLWLPRSRSARDDFELRGDLIHQQKAPASRPGLFWFFYDGMRKAGALQGSQAAFKDGRGLEADRLRSSDLHGFSSLRVAALASCALFDFESSETDDLDFLVLPHAFGDRRENGFEGFVGSTLGSVFSEGGLDGFNEFSFIHGSDVCANAVGCWQEKIY